VYDGKTMTSTPPAALAELARRIERAEAEQLVRTGAPGVAGALEVAGGIAVSKGPASPFNVANGLGLEGPVTAADVDAVEAHLGAGGGAIRIALAAPAHPSLGAELARRGYRVERFHLVWWRAPAPEVCADVPVEIRPIGAGEERPWGETFALAFFGRLPPSDAMLEALLAMPRAEGNVCFAAFDAGRPVGVAMASAHGGVATLSGAGVLPAHRGRGLQRALVAARLTWAAARGCELAASATDPGTASQRNLERSGFRCAYPRAILVREPAPRA
jgi:GNAT superfamily N-acetyltransferase